MSLNTPGAMRSGLMQRHETTKGDNMKRFFRHYFLALCIGLTPMLALAAPDIVPNIKAIEENPYTFMWIFALAILLAFGLGLRMLHLSDKNNTAHWRETRSLRRDLTDVEKDILVLKTDHKHNHGGSDDLHFRRSQRD